MLQSLLAANEPLALAPQVLVEFVHVVTDPKRFESPLDVPQALARADQWWQGSQVVQVLPSDESTMLFLHWMEEHKLGRKRLLDTQLAATYYCADVRTLVTTNGRDYKVFGCFSIVEPGLTRPSG